MRIDAAEAYRIGLVNQVVPLADLMNAAIEMAQRICANAPLAVQTAKMAVWLGLDLPLADGLRLENTLGEPLRQTEDVQEGIAAFAETPAAIQGRLTRLAIYGTNRRSRC